MTEPESVTSLFTFGYSQLCPYTGKDLGDHYALITAPDRSSARLFMNTAFKRNYAFEYDGPGDVKIADYVPRMTLHITVNLVPEQQMPPGFGYSRADDGESPQPSAGRIPAHHEDARTGEVVMVGGLTAVPVAGGLIEVDQTEGFVPASGSYATFAEQREAYERDEAMRLPRCPNCRGRHHAVEPCR